MQERIGKGLVFCVSRLYHFLKMPINNCKI